MRIPSNEASSIVRIEFHWSVLAKLERDPETVDLCGPMAEVATELERVYAERLACEKAEVIARSRLDAAEGDLEAVLRVVARRAVVEAPGRGPGTLLGDVLPDGVEKAIRPRRKEQVQVASEALGRLDRCTLPGADALRAACRTLLAARVDDLGAMLRAHVKAVTALEEVMHVELRVRSEHAREVDRLAGALRARFPRDRRRQESFWPKTPRRRRSAADEVATPTVLPSVNDAA
jgi:hypothetical protein